MKVSGAFPRVGRDNMDGLSSAPASVLAHATLEGRAGPALLLIRRRAPARQQGGQSAPAGRARTEQELSGPPCRGALARTGRPGGQKHRGRGRWPSLEPELVWKQSRSEPTAKVARRWWQQRATACCEGAEFCFTMRYHFGGGGGGGGLGALAQVESAPGRRSGHEGRRRARSLAVACSSLWTS